MAASIFYCERPNYLWVGKIENNAIKERGSSKSLKASIKSGYLYRTKWLREIFGLWDAKYRIFPISPLAFALLYFFK